MVFFARMLYRYAIKNVVMAYFKGVFWGYIVYIYYETHDDSMLQLYIMRVYHQGILYRFTMKYVMTACYNGILRAYDVKTCH